MSAIYSGPQCPMCGMPLEAAVLRSGAIECPSCSRVFEATPFEPRVRHHAPVQVVTETPDGATTACAHHARNAAVTSCQRCGLFICALCDMNVDGVSYCPSCFDRVRNEGALQARYRDWASMAIAGAVIGLLCIGIPLGPFVVYWAVKGIRQRRAEGRGTAGVTTALVLGVVETIAFLAAVVLTIMSAAAEATS